VENVVHVHAEEYFGDSKGSTMLLGYRTPDDAVGLKAYFRTSMPLMRQGGYESRANPSRSVTAGELHCSA
jgi:hypothetical protein